MLPTGTGDSEGGKVMVEKKNKEVTKSTGSAKRGKKNEIPASLKGKLMFSKGLWSSGSIVSCFQFFKFGMVFFHLFSG